MKDLSVVPCFSNDNIDYIYDSLTHTVLKEATLRYINYLISINKPFSVYFLDLDNFKEINDTLGHQIGDYALRDTAAQILECVGDNGLVGRFGGDEFIVVLEDVVDYDEIWQNCRTITQNIKKKHLDYLNDVVYFGAITVTLGAAKFPDDAQDIDDLISVADKALYRGKTKGKNCFIIYKKELHSHIDPDGGPDKLEVENLIEYLYSEFSMHKNNPDVSLKIVVDFLAHHFNLDAVSKTGKNKFDLIVNYNDVLKPAYIPVSLYLKSSGDIPIYALNYRTHLNATNPELFEYFIEQQIRSTIFIRCQTKKKVYGYLRIDNKRERIWSRDEKYVFQILGNLYAYSVELADKEF